VRIAIDALRPAADAKRIKIEIELDSTRCLVRGDPNRLRQVIWNLLMNGIKFTPRRGCVSLRLECFAEQRSAKSVSSSGPLSAYVRLTVSDTGDGITPEFLPYVFHRFRQEEGSISRKAGGLGLGLAVVRHLVELHGGSVSAESAGSGRGSVFTVDLPLATERRDKNPSESDESSGEFERRTTDGSRADQEVIRSAIRSDGGASKSTSAVGARPLNGVRVLLVEDDDDSRNLLSLILSRYGAEVMPTSSSAEALDSFMQKTPDVVISDIGMAEEDGYELIRKLRILPVQGSLLPGSPDSLPGLIPAIALTGYATIKDRDRALAAGYQLHLAKPVEPDELVAAIRNLIRLG
jgi:CheY-like chemotaxis protein